LSKLKVAVFCTQYQTVKSGPGRFVQYLRESEFADCELTFFSDQIKETEAYRISVPVHPVFTRLPLYWLARNRMFFQAFQPVMKDYDVVLCTSALEALDLIKLRKQIPVIVMVNDYNLVRADKDFWLNRRVQGWSKTISRYWHRRLEKEVCRKASCVITNSEHTSQIVMENYPVDRQRIKKLYKAVDLKIFTPTPDHSYSRLPDVPRLLFLKNNFLNGGADIIAEALSEWPDDDAFDLTIAGISPGQVEAVKKLFIPAGRTLRNFKVYELLKRSQVVELYRTHDIFINMARLEALGVSCLEAMASGLPVVASGVGGLPEVLANGKAGFMIALDPKTLRECLWEIKKNPVILAEKQYAMKEQVAKFSRINMVDNLNKLLVGVLNK
jgi:glycosyltransferase involved in cell wall biosynthesis